MLQILGLNHSGSWITTAAFALGGLAAIMAFSPVADRLAGLLAAAPPRLGMFKPLRKSTLNLIAGIALAWLLGGFAEEIVFRGLALRWVEEQASMWMSGPVASAVAILAAAIGAGMVHLYQGPRGAIIITQLSVLFGLVYVVSGHDLWAVILCHGLYDTIAFARFARGRSRYAAS